MNTIASLIQRIQESDDGTKRIVALAMIIVAMSIVFILWRAYVSSVLDVASQADAEKREPVSADEFSFWASVKGGTAAVYHSLTGLFDRNYELKPERQGAGQRTPKQQAQ